MIKKITFSLFTLFACATIHAQITFDWDTSLPESDTNNTTEFTQTIAGVTTTFTSTTENGRIDLGGIGGSTGFAISSSFDGSTSSSSVTFAFSEAVDVTSIIALEFNAAFVNSTDIDLTFTPTGGSNTAVTQKLSQGRGTVNLNWTGATSFTVTIAGGGDGVFIFDNLVVTPTATASIGENNLNDATVYPNPVKNILYIKNAQNFTSASVYNVLGQPVLETKNTEIDFSNLKSGVYILKISTDNGSVSRKIVKQ